jgi:hypothetical protein
MLAHPAAFQAAPGSYPVNLPYWRRNEVLIPTRRRAHRVQNGPDLPADYSSVVIAGWIEHPASGFGNLRSIRLSYATLWE